MEIFYFIFSSDKPTPPQNLGLKDVFADRCSLSWKPPADDGGGAISGLLRTNKLMASSNSDFDVY